MYKQITQKERLNYIFRNFKFFLTLKTHLLDVDLTKNREEIYKKNFIRQWENSFLNRSKTNVKSKNKFEAFVSQHKEKQ